VHAVYDELPSVLSTLGLGTVEGILFDLGVSSMQLDEADRGFAYSVDAPLDMRMDQGSGLTAADVLNTYDTAALIRILRDFGEERFAPRIAARIVRERKVAPFTNSGRLVEIVRDSIPAATRRTGGNPAKRTFQALRIEVNAELAVLERAIPAALDSLAVGGRIVVMAYQSLEDRIVKHALAEGARVRAPHGLPIIPDSMQPWLRLLTRGAEKPTDEELSENPRSASVRVRAAERLAVAA
jgi:16S rRNA (cytosine1402-N4)-methyltransferase